MAISYSNKYGDRRKLDADRRCYHDGLLIPDLYSVSWQHWKDETLVKNYIEMFDKINHLKPQLQLPQPPLPTGKSKTQSKSKPQASIK